MPCTDENICFGSLQSTVKGFILFPFADRSFRLFTHWYRFCNNIIGTCIMLSCVFDKNTRGQYKHWQTHTYSLAIATLHIDSVIALAQSKRFFKWTDTIHQTMKMFLLTTMMVITDDRAGEDVKLSQRERESASISPLCQYLLQHSQPAENMFSTHKKQQLF